MDSLEFVELAERDSRLIPAIRRALVAMTLTHGASIRMGNITGTLNYENEMLGLRNAMFLLGADPDHLPGEPHRGFD